MKILECFDHAFVINLRKDTLRFVEVSEELIKHEIPFERLEGVVPATDLRGKRRGHLGCMLAHLSAVTEARKRGYQSVAIIEDDITLRPNFRSLWSDLVSELNSKPYDLFFLYRWAVQANLVRPIRIVPITATLCMHFYAVHSEFYNRYIEAVENQLQSREFVPIDRLFRAPEARIFSSSYNLAGQKAGPSNISFNPRKSTSFIQVRGRVKAEANGRDI